MSHKTTILFAALFGLCATACDTPGPVIEALSSTRDSVRPGEEFYLRVETFDPDGDLLGGRILIEMTGQQEGLELEEEVEITEIPEDPHNVDLFVALQIIGGADFDDYEIEVIVEDADGWDSNAESVNVRLGVD